MVKKTVNRLLRNLCVLLLLPVSDVSIFPSGLFSGALFPRGGTVFQTVK